MSQTTEQKKKSQFHQGFTGVNNKLELDSAPGSYPRGPELMAQILEGTSLKNGEDVVCTGTFFGNYKFQVNPEKDKEYEEAKSKIADRITELYESGRIRYASW
jgi:hypothetical protein